MILMRVGLLSNLNSCGFSRIIFSSTECRAIIKRVVCFYYVNCIFFACLIYFSNSFLIVSYNGDIRLRLMLTANQVGLCWTPEFFIIFYFKDRCRCRPSPSKKCETACSSLLLTILYRQLPDILLCCKIKAILWYITDPMLLQILINPDWLPCALCGLRCSI